MGMGAKLGWRWSRGDRDRGEDACDNGLRDFGGVSTYTDRRIPESGADVSLASSSESYRGWTSSM